MPEMLETKLIRWFIALVIAIALPLAMAGMGFSVKWGAHPWWAFSTALIGAIIGITFGLLFSLIPRAPATVIALVGLGVAIAVAYFGKTQFATSFAEDIFAGKLWYFGWVGIAAGMTATVLAYLAPRQKSQ